MTAASTCPVCGAEVESHRTCGLTIYACGGDQFGARCSRASTLVLEQRDEIERLKAVIAEWDHGHEVKP